MKSHKILGENLLGPYEDELSKPIPADLKAFLSHLSLPKAQGETVKTDASQLYAQINILTSQLADRIRYMGDWRTVDGRFKPRAIAKIF